MSFVVVVILGNVVVILGSVVVGEYIVPVLVIKVGGSGRSVVGVPSHVSTVQMENILTTNVMIADNCLM